MTPEERAEALEVRERALALVNVARAAVGGGELADFPAGRPGAQDTHHPLVAALAPCGVRWHLGFDVECVTWDDASTLRAAWGADGFDNVVQFGAPLAALTRFIDLFDGGAYPDLVAGTDAPADAKTEVA